jgi:replicative DNA helicase
MIAAADFYDPLHAKIWEIADKRVQEGVVASPVTLKALFQDDPAMTDVGGVGYLARLAGAAVSVAAARDYASIIVDMAHRRRAIASAEAAIEAAKDMTRSASEVVNGVVSDMETIAASRRGERLVVTWAQAVNETLDAVAAAYQGEESLCVSTGFEGAR